ncbi:choline/ethanolamine transporter flvcr2b-like [Ciona intestinalis]
MATNAATESTETKAYKVRWLVLAVAIANGFQRSFCQSCFGQINNVLVKILHVEPWQIDWLVTVRSVSFVLLSIPVALIANRIGFRNCMLAMNALQCSTFSLLVVGVRVKGGYYLMLVSQALMSGDGMIGFGNLPLLAGLWFPSNEVASAVSIQLVARGAGEAIGSVSTPLIVNIRQANDVIIFRLTMLFVPFLVLSVILFLVTYTFISESPPLPPSVAQMKKKNANANKERLQFIESLKQNCTSTLKDLLLNKSFNVFAVVAAFIAPLLRSITILLSSMLHREFPSASGLNLVSGNLLLIAWILYTVAALLTGLIITKCKKYRAIAVVGAFTECVTGILIFTGMWTKLKFLIYAGVILLGIGAGITDSSFFELLVEITYPKPLFLVTSLYMVLIGSARFIYPVVDRALLKYGAPASTAPHAILMSIAFILLVSVPMHFKRLEADTSSESTPLIDE